MVQRSKASIQSNVVNLEEPALSAVSSRMSRQQVTVSMISVFYGLEIEDNAGVQAYSALLQAQQVDIDLTICGSLGEEGWEASKDGLVNVKKENIQSIWEATGPGAGTYSIVWSTDWDMLDGYGVKATAKHET